MARLVQIFLSFLLISACQISKISQIEKKCSMICEINNHTMNYSISLNGNFAFMPENGKLTMDLRKKVMRGLNRYNKYCKASYFDFHAIQKNEFQYQIFAETHITNARFPGLRKDTLEYLYKKIFLIDSNFINTEKGTFKYNNKIYEYVRFNLFDKNKIHSFTFFAHKGNSDIPTIINEGISQLVTFRNSKMNLKEKYKFLYNDTNGFHKFNYQVRLDNLKENLSGYTSNGNTSSNEMSYTFLSYYNSFIGKNDSAKYYDELRYIKTVDTIPFQKQCDNSSVKEISPISFNDFFSLAEVKESQLIFLNESHHLNINRDIGILFLRRLKEIGFTYFAVEGLTNDSSTRISQMPSYRSGYYMQSRNFIDLLKEANNLGFKILSYEDTVENNNWKIREKNQADNLFNKTYLKDPLAKVFVYCGYAHLRKDTLVNKYFAHYLQEKSRVKALSVRQTLYYNHYFPILNAKCFFEISRKASNEFPFFIENKSKKMVDFDIITPNTSLRLLDTFTHVYIKEYVNDRPFDYILFFDKSEFNNLYTDAIPLINMSKKEISENEQSVKLPEGIYTVILLNKNFQQLDRFDLNVK